MGGDGHKHRRRSNRSSFKRSLGCGNDPVAIVREMTHAMIIIDEITKQPGFLQGTPEIDLGKYDQNLIRKEL